MVGRCDRRRLRANDGPMTAASRPDTSLTDRHVGVLWAIGFAAVPILMLAVLVGTLALLVSPPV